MTEEEPMGNKSLDDFFSCMDELTGVSESAERIKHPLGEVSDRYDEKLRQYAFSSAKRYDPNFKGESADKLNSGEVERYVAKGQNAAQESAAKILKDSLDDILGNVPKDNLENILSDEKSLKLILQSADDEDGEKIAKYVGYKGLERAIASYDKKGTTGNEELDGKVKSLAVTGAQEEQRNHLKSLGFSRRLQDMGAELVSISYAAGNYSSEKIKEYAMNGLKAEMEKAKSKINENEVYAAIRNSIRKMVKSEVPEVYSTAMNLVYNLVKGKGK